MKRTHATSRRHGVYARSAPLTTVPETLTSLCRDLGPVVYFIRNQADGLIKVGWTEQLATRKRAFGSGWEHILAITPGSLEDESSWHARLSPHLARGREWFYPHADVFDVINEIRGGYGLKPVAA